MYDTVFAIVAALLGSALGFFFASTTARKREQQQEGHIRELTARLQSTESERNQALAAERSALDRLAAAAAFEKLAADRATQIAALGADFAATREQFEALRSAHTALTGKSSQQIAALETALEEERRRIPELRRQLDEDRQALTRHFELMANEILEKKSKSFSEGSQKELGSLLTPLREQLDAFRKRVEEAQSDSKTGVTRLETLVTQLNSMNQQLSDEARNLATALRGSSKTQGDWGEFILRDLLDKAGLREGEQYSFQQSFTTTGESGERKAQRTDVIVTLPGGRSLVIDSKTSLNAWQDANAAATDEERAAAVKRHLASLRAHVDELGRRQYHALPGIESPDFVIMFVPLEPAYLGALREDPNLWAYGWEQHVLLVGPTTLLFVIRIVENLWQQEVQARSVRELMDRGGELYDKFVGFASDLEALGSALNKADSTYSAAMKKLSTGRGNLVRQVEMLQSLGIRSQKQMPKALLDASEEPLSLSEAEA